jgi:hypothetical protein
MIVIGRYPIYISERSKTRSQNIPYFARYHPRARQRHLYTIRTLRTHANYWEATETDFTPIFSLFRGTAFGLKS